VLAHLVASHVRKNGKRRKGEKVRKVRNYIKLTKEK
jgi:hypothetical protein